jgi:hypothetical protein
MLVAQCAVFAPKPAGVSGARVIRVKVVADPSFASHAMWEKNARNLIDNASAFYRDWFEVAFVIDTMVVWDIEAEPCHTVMFDWDCLVKSVPRGNADIVIHFTKERRLTYGLAGISLFDFGYVRVTQSDWGNLQGGYEKAFMTLVHELGHQFGAFHVYLDDRYKQLRVMNPYLSDKLITKQGMQTTITMPDWHPANQIVVRALRSRPFSVEGWTAEQWPAIEAAYREARAQYLPFRVDSAERLSNHEQNELYQPDYYYFLAGWASLCGLDSCAMSYIDSMATVLRAIRRTCVECAPHCATHLCRYTGSSEWRIDEWLDRRLAMYHFERATLNARFGRTSEAARDFAEFDKLWGDDLRSTDKRKYRASLELYQAEPGSPQKPDSSAQSDTATAADSSVPRPLEADTLGRMPAAETGE